MGSDGDTATHQPTAAGRFELIVRGGNDGEPKLFGGVVTHGSGVYEVVGIGRERLDCRGARMAEPFVRAP